VRHLTWRTYGAQTDFNHSCYKGFAPTEQFVVYYILAFSHLSHVHISTFTTFSHLLHFQIFKSSNFQISIHHFFSSFFGADVGIVSEKNTPDPWNGCWKIDTAGFERSSVLNFGLNGLSVEVGPDCMNALFSK